MLISSSLNGFDISIDCADVSILNLFWFLLVEGVILHNDKYPAFIPK